MYKRQLLIKAFVRDCEQVGDTRVRARYGTLSGAVGIAANVLLFAAKLAVGTLAGSVSIVADAVNNLSDAGSSIISLLGFKTVSYTHLTASMTAAIRGARGLFPPPLAASVTRWATSLSTWGKARWATRGSTSTMNCIPCR